MSQHLNSKKARANANEKGNRKKIMDYAKKCDRRGFTVSEAIHCDITHHNSFRPTLYTLMDEGYLSNYDKTRKVDGNDSTVYCLAEFAEYNVRVENVRSKNLKKHQNSVEWKNRKQQYYRDCEKICFVTGAKNDIDLHHISYDNQYEELDDDLIPLCGFVHMGVENLVSEGVPRNRAHLVYKKNWNDKSTFEKIQKAKKKQPIDMQEQVDLFPPLEVE